MGGTKLHLSARAGMAAVLFIACLAVPGPIRADYLITRADATVRTQCYWIERSMLHLCEGGEPVALSEVGAIETGTASALDAELHRDTLRRFFTSLAWLGDREAEVTDLDDALAEGLEGFDDPVRRKVHKEKMRELRGKLLGDVQDIRASVVRLKNAWEGIRIPERKLVKLADLKSLQFLTWLQSLQEREISIKTLDPTFRALAQEHRRQSLQFEALYVRNVLQSGSGSAE